MSKRINDLVIEDEYIEWGIEFDNNEDGWSVAVMEDETDARKTQMLTGGRVVVRTVFESAWATA